MARPVKGGWDFVEEGKSYQYKEGGFIAQVTVLEDNSNEEFYDFKLRIDKSNAEPPMKEFPLQHRKDSDGIYSGMSQLYETDEYMCNYKWENDGSG